MTLYFVIPEINPMKLYLFFGHSLISCISFHSLW